MINKLIYICVFVLALLGIGVALRQNSEPPLKKKKLLVLIIASDNHPAFLALQDAWRSYMHLDRDNIEAYFIKGDPSIKSSSEIQEDILFTQTQDSYKPGILKKTVLSLESLSKRLDEFEYVLRTNLSSFYVFPNLLAFLDKLPKKQCYAAQPLLPSHDVPVEYSKTPFGWGAGFIISSDLAKQLVNAKEEVFKRSAEIPDDVLIGDFFYRRRIPLIPIACYSLKNPTDWQNGKDKFPPDAFHFRAKSHDSTRKLEDPYHAEIYLLSELINHFYPAAQYKPQWSSYNPLNIGLKTLYLYHSTYPSDINEHLPILYELAKECCSATEIGLRSMVSTWALLQGLSMNSATDRTYTGIDLASPPPISLMLAKKISYEHKIDFNFVEANDMDIDIEQTDLLFIDSLHTYAHLSYEMEKFAPKTKKYIVLHDTSEPWGYKDDTEYQGNYGEYPQEIDKTKRGLWPAVMDFLFRHPEWTLKDHRANNHGLTILQRS